MMDTNGKSITLREVEADKNYYLFVESPTPKSELTIAIH